MYIDTNCYYQHVLGNYVLQLILFNEFIKQLLKIEVNRK